MSNLTLFDESGGGPPLCHLCNLYKDCKSPRMPVTGKGRKKVLLIGEAPGKDEDAQNCQFVGAAGEYLWKAIKSLGYRRDDCWSTNAIICRPPRNIIDVKYLNACRPALLRTIEDLAPRVIIALGKSAIMQVLQDDWARSFGAVAEWRGWQIPNRRLNAWVCTAYHPSYVNRMGVPTDLDLIFKSDLKKAFAKLDESLIDYTPLDKLKEECIVLTCSPSKSRAYLEACVELPGDLMVFDYETNALKPEVPGARILSMSCSWEGKSAWSGIIDESCYPALRTLLSEKRIRKVGANLKFEDRWSRAIVGTPVVGWYWDTMLSAHLLDNRGGISSLDFQAFVRLGIPDYSSHLDKFKETDKRTGLNRLHLVRVPDLLMYGALDSLLTFRVMESQKKEMDFVDKT